jgi:hypothetical protein
MRELSVAERYLAVLAVIAEGHPDCSVAQQWGVPADAAWLRRYEAGGLEALADWSHRPVSCPHQMPPLVEAAALRLRRQHRGWGSRRIVVEMARRGVAPLPSESGVYRALTRAGLIEPAGRRRRREAWKRAGSGARRWSCGRWKWSAGSA